MEAAFTEELHKDLRVLKRRFKASVSQTLDRAQKAVDEASRATSGAVRSSEGLVKDLRAAHTSLHTAISKMTRTVGGRIEREASMLDMCPPEHAPDALETKEDIARLLVDHYAAAGRLTVADAIADDAGVERVPDSRRAVLASIREASEAVRRGVLWAAVRWATENSAFLLALGSSLEFDLHALHSVAILLGHPVAAVAAAPTALLRGGEGARKPSLRVRRTTAFRYIRAVFPALLRAAASSDSCGIPLSTFRALSDDRDGPLELRMAASLRRLCAAVLSAGEEGLGEESPYSDLAAPEKADEVAARLERCMKLYHGIPHTSVLSDMLQAASIAAPGLNKLARVLSASLGTGGDETDGDEDYGGDEDGQEDGDSRGALTARIRRLVGSEGELPVEVRLPPSLHDRSAFVCPVSRQQCGALAPPVLLACGHAISKPAMASLAGRGGRFSCPICHAPVSRDDVLELLVEF